MDDNTRARLETICRHLSACGSDFTITDDTSFVTDLQLDSLDRLELRLFAEDEFTIEIRDSEIDEPETATFGGMLALIERKRAALTVGG